MGGGRERERERERDKISNENDYIVLGKGCHTTTLMYMYMYIVLSDNLLLDIFLCRFSFESFLSASAFTPSKILSIYNKAGTNYAALPYNIFFFLFSTSITV